MTMSLEQILAKIIADAKAEAAGIEDKGSEEAERILAAGETQAKEIEERLVAKARVDAEEKAARTLTLARIDARSARLAAKQEAVELAFQEALVRLQAMPADDYRRFLFEQLMLATRSGEEEVILSARDAERFGSELIAEANAALSRAGRPANLRLSASNRQVTAGLILRDGAVETNCTFEAALRLAHDELVPLVADRLFRDSPGDGS